MCACVMALFPINQERKTNRKKFQITADHRNCDTKSFNGQVETQNKNVVDMKNN